MVHLPPDVYIRQSLYGKVGVKLGEDRERKKEIVDRERRKKKQRLPEPKSAHHHGLLIKKNYQKARAIPCTLSRASNLVSLAGNSPHADEAIGVTSEEGLAIGRPREAEASWGLLGVSGLSWDILNENLVLEVPNLDGRSGSSAKPVAVGAEDKSVDLLLSIKSAKPRVVAEIPKHGLTVLATRGAEGTIGGNGDGVDVTRVADEVALELAVGEIPNLDLVVPSRGDNDRLLSVGGEADARDPLGVALLLDDELALGKDVPKADRFIARSGDNLTVISRESNRENVLLVTDEAASALTRAQVPKAEGAVP